MSERECACRRARALAIPKLMAMSSFLINSNYVDPKFPPCEEYSQHDYLPSHSPEYFSGQRREENSFQHEALYPARSACNQPSYPPCQSSGHQPSVLSPRGQRVQTPAGLPNHLSEPNHTCESITPSPPPSCSQNSLNQSPSSCKEPVVYPWMKKVHVSTGK